MRQPGPALDTGNSLAPGVAAVGDAAARKLHLFVLVAGVLWLVFWYRDTFMAMVEIWDRSETFAHGFVIAPISAWLIWRRRHFIDYLPFAPSLAGIVIGLGAGLAWLLGQLSSVDAVSQFAVVGMLIGLVWSIMGTAVVRTYAFPLGFLFFMVPFGEFMFPTMMEWTASFIIWAVRASGVPVYAEGYNLVIPSGRWARTRWRWTSRRSIRRWSNPCSTRSGSADLKRLRSSPYPSSRTTTSTPNAFAWMAAFACNYAEKRQLPK